MRLSIAAVLIMIVAWTATATADTTWVSLGYVSGEWNAAGSPYMIQGDITVAEGTALHIGPGVTVFFTGPYSLYVDTSGSISALGTENDSALFVTDTLSNPAWWDGITVTSAADTCRFDYCVFAFAGAHSNALSISESDAQVSHCSFRFNGSRITGGDGAGLGLIWHAWAYVRECDFLGGRASNGAAAFVHESSAIFDTCRFEFNQAWMLGGTADVWTFRTNTASPSGNAYFCTTAAA
jgi:hypothetical protein